MGAAGCAAQAHAGHSAWGASERVAAARPPAPPAPDAADDEDQHIRALAEEELGPTVAAELPPVKVDAPSPQDPGASVLVNELLSGLGPRERDVDGETRICISKIRNLSRAQPTEFNELLERFADVLTRSGRDANLVFTVHRRDGAVHYDMLGTAYLITAEGFDLWELFITITPADTSWTVWQPGMPIRILRQPRAHQQQIFFGR